MGAELSTQRVRALTEMGFGVTESRLALEATNGNVSQAAALLTARRREREQAEGGVLARRINALLREQRPWGEFFGRFLWPEHLPERVQTNLFYFRANCLPRHSYLMCTKHAFPGPHMRFASLMRLFVREAVRARSPSDALICAGLTLLAVLIRPALLLIAGLSASLLAGAIAWSDTQPVPILNQPLGIEQRVAATALANAVLINVSGHTADVARILFVCAGVVLAHAAFRARSLASRWSFFKESID